jgi:hypothetical protein
LGLQLLTDDIYRRGDEDVYDCPGVNTQVHVQGGRVYNVACWERVEYKGMNLLGLGLNELEQLFGVPESQEAEEGVQYLEYCRFGLIIALEDGLVDQVTCFGPVEDESTEQHTETQSP